MAIESVIELKVVGLDELESRLKALNNLTVNMGGGAGGRPPLTEQEKQEREKEKAEKRKAKEEDKKKLEEEKKSIATLKEWQKQQDVLRRKQEEFSKALGKASFDVAKFGTSVVFDTSKKLAGAFVGITKAIVGVGGLLSGIASVVSLTGLIRASQDVSRRTYQATGYGLTNPNVIGRLQSTYGKFSDVQGGFAALTEAAVNPASITMGALANIMSSTGTPTSASELRGMEAEKRYQSVSEALFKASKNPELFRMLSNPILVESMGLQGLAGPEIMQRYKSYSESQFAELKGIGESRRGLLEMPTGTRFAYEKFGAQRETGMAAVENQLLIAMKPVLEPINRVFTAVATKLFSGASKFDEFIKGLATDINLFADAISYGKWQEFFDKIAEQAKAMWESIKPYALKAWDEIEKFALASWEKVSKWFVEEFPKHADKAWRSVSEWFDSHFKNASNDLRDFLEVIKDITIILRDLRDLLNQIKKVFWFLNTSLPEEAQQGLDVFSRMSGAGQGPWNFIHNFPTLLGGFSGLYKPTAHEMLQTAQSKIEGATRYFSNEMGFGAAGEGLDYEFLKKLNQMKGAMPPELGGFSISSGHRSEESQQKIWNEAVKKYGSEAAARKWAAKPGASSHQFGLAADLKFSSDKAKKWIHEHASEFGLNFRLQNEDWHIEPIGARERINEMRVSGSYRKSAFNNASLPTGNYAPSGTTGGKTGMSPVITLKSYNSPENNTAWAFSNMFGQLNTDNPYQQ